MSSNDVFNYLWIDSNYKKSGTDDNFTIELPTDGYRHFHIEKIVLPNSIYPFRTGVNTVLQFISNANVWTTTITQGNYATPQLLATEIQSRLNLLTGSSGVTFTVSFSSTSFKFTITGTGSNFAFIWDKSTPYLELGFNLGTDAAGLTRTSDYIGNISGFDVINVYSDALLRHNTNVISAGEYRLLAKVSLDQPFGSTCYYTTPLNALFDLAPNFKGIIDFKFMDQYNRPINFNGRNVLIKIKLYRNTNVINF